MCFWVQVNGKDAGMRIALLVLSILGFCHTAFGWGSQGHQVIASLAQAQLTPAAAKEVQHLLTLEPGATLMSVSTWADEHKNPQTAAWHFVNFPRGDCTYQGARDCAGGQCVVAAIQKQIDVLDSKEPDARKLNALKYLVHLVGDVHQPLHAGFADDKGGNKYQLQAFLKGSNLHAVWDSGLIKNLNESTEELTARLQKLNAGLPTSDLNPVHAAEESCRIVSLKGFYPERLVDVPYIERYTPVLERRLASAGARLAGVLNAVFQDASAHR